MTTPSLQAAQAHNAQALQSMRAGDFANAAVQFRAALALDPAAGPLWRNLAHACRQMGDETGERAALDEALALDRTDLTALIRLAQLLERQGQARDALLHWNGVLQLGAHIGDPSPDLAAVLSHAKAYCNEQQLSLFGGVNAVLAADFASLGPSDARRARAFVDHALGGRPIYRNECAGIYYPFLPADEFFDDFHFPWFADLSAATGAIRDELLGLMAGDGAEIRPYVQMDSGTPANKWSTLDHSLDWSACFLWEYGKPNQPVLDRCPETVRVLEAVMDTRMEERTPNAFFSILRAHTHIPPHTGVTNTRAIIHLPLIVPADCGFRVGGETREWQEGRPFAFDDTIEHEAWNKSEDLRAVLIFDVWNPHLSAAERNIIERYFATADHIAG